jgi:heme/copper-type cytochrome/quinol oxidase subunit 3
MAEAGAHAEEYTALGLPHRKVGFWTFIGSECMFFGALIGTYLAYHGKSVVGPYPQDVFNPMVTSLSTFTLLMSSFFMVMALHFVRAGRRSWGGYWLLMTALGGLVFLGFQAFEFTEFYRHGLTLQTNLFGTTFFVLLFVLNARGVLGPEKELDVEICGLYWHFVDIVWIVIFTVVYLLEFAQ